jgi:YHS domain-containing protein
MTSHSHITLALFATLAVGTIFADESKSIQGLAVPNRVTAIQFVSAVGAADVSKQVVSSAPAVAGVRYVIVRDGSPEEVGALSSQFPESAPLVSFVSSSSLSDLPAEDARPSLVIFDAGGKEAFRVAADAKTLSSGQIAKELVRITSSGARTDQNVTPSEPAVSGYDVVSYHDGAPKMGSEKFTSIYEGNTYQFATAANLKKFAESPEAYAPAYGGWCAWAMLDGDKVEVDPETYKIVDGQLLLYYNGFFGNTLKKWNKVGDDKGQASKAAAQWESLKGK